ncbi:MAG: tetratricopeptide repeat protein [Thermoguttaceae bacterium]|nr:tetratricopeptide repeat protein [Thermoguttaceae bacterium]
MKNHHQIETDNEHWENTTKPDDSAEQLSADEWSSEANGEENSSTRKNSATTHPRWRLIIAGVAAFIAWGIALTIVWREARLDTTMEPSATTASVLETLKREAIELHKLAQGQPSLILPNLLEPTGWAPENDFLAEDREYLQNVLDGRRMPGMTEDQKPMGTTTSTDVPTGTSTEQTDPRETSADSLPADSSSTDTPEVEALPGMPEDIVSETSAGPSQPATTNETVGKPETSANGVEKPSEAASTDLPADETDENGISEENGTETGVSAADGLILQYHLEANQELTRILQQSPDTPELLLVAANYFRLFGRYSEALQVGHQYLNEIQLSVSPTTHKPKVKPSGNPQTSETTSVSPEPITRMQSQGWLFLAEVALEANQGSDAIGLFEKAFASGATSDSALYSLATAQYRTGQYDVSIETLQSLLKKYPRRLPYHILYGKCLTAQGRYTSAKSEFEQVTRWAPQAAESMEAWLGLAICAARLNETGVSDYEQQYQTLRAQLEELPDVSGHFADHAQLLRGRRATSELLVMLAGVYSTNQLLQTDRLLRRALVINMHSDSARSMMAHLFEQQELIDDAIQVLEEGCTETPPSSICASELGQLCQRRGLYAEAEKGFLMAIAAEPRNAEYYAILARFYLKTKQKSNDAFLRAMAAADLDPSADHYMLLAAAALANGDLSAAKTAAQNALEINPQNTECQKLLEQLVK